MLYLVVGCGSECPDGHEAMGGRCVRMASLGDAAMTTDGGRASTNDSAIADAPIGDDGCVARTFYPDDDGDGFGDDALAMNTCGERPEGFVGVGGDCDDRCASCRPSERELCDALDNDCDGTPDDGHPVSTYYRDMDGDGVGGEMSRDTCVAGRGYVDIGGDCNDADPSVWPGATELCDHKDNDCEGRTDEGKLVPLLPGTVVHSGGHTEDSYPSIAATDDAVIVTWPSQGRALYGILDTNGNTIVPSTALYPASTREQHDPSVAVYSADRAWAYVVFRDYYDVVGVRIALDGSVREAPRVLTTLEADGRPSIVAAGNRLYVAWHRTRGFGGPTVYARAIDGMSGEPMGEEAFELDLPGATTPISGIVADGADALMGEPIETPSDSGFTLRRLGIDTSEEVYRQGTDYLYEPGADNPFFVNLVDTGATGIYLVGISGSNGTLIAPITTVAGAIEVGPDVRYTPSVILHAAGAEGEIDMLTFDGRRIDWVVGEDVPAPVALPSIGEGRIVRASWGGGIALPDQASGDLMFYRLGCP